MLSRGHPSVLPDEAGSLYPGKLVMFSWESDLFFTCSDLRQLSVWVINTQNYLKRKKKLNQKRLLIVVPKNCIEHFYDQVPVFISS